MLVRIVCRKTTYETDHLDTAGVKFRLEFRKGAQLGCANRGEVCGVAEEDCPFSVEEVVEVLVGISCCFVGCKGMRTISPWVVFAWKFGAGVNGLV